LGYPITQSLQGITGIALFNFYSQNELSRIEYRPYQEVNSTQSFGKISVQHRFRTEARFFRNVSEAIKTPPSNFNFRFRYRIYCSIPLLKWSEVKPDRTLSFNIGDEVFINAGKEIIYNAFDNNRFLVGLTFEHNDNLSFTVSFIDQFGQRASPATYERSAIFTLGIRHKLSLCK
jgi:hypothetical protein